MNRKRFAASFMPQDSVLRPSILETLNAINAVQQGPETPTVSITVYAAVYPFGRYVPGDGKPARIELSQFGPHPHLTFTHEVGHLLDQAMLGYNGNASTRLFSPARGVMQTIRRSGAYRALEAVRRSAGADLNDLLARRRADYWLADEELWARAYAQYIAVRSNNAALLAQLALARQLETHPAAPYVQWERADFAPLSEAIDDAFESLGWLP